MKHKLIIGGLIITVVIVVVLTRPHIAQEPKQIQRSEPPVKITKSIISNFSFIYRYSKYNEISILGTAALGVGVTLLETTSTKHCTAVTDKNAVGGWAGPIELTTLTAQQNCGSVDRYSVVVVGTKVKDYQLISNDKISDELRISEIDSKIRNTKMLESLKVQAQGSLSGDEYFPIYGRPTVYRVDIPKQEIFIVSYDVQRQERLQQGPRAIIVNGQSYPLTGWCSYPYFRTFMLNGAYYIESGSHCCGCGITIQELFEIKNDGVKLVWDDDSYSD